LTAGCDLTPGEDSAFESTSPSDSGTIYVYRLDGDPDGDVNQAGFSSRCLNGGRNTLTTVISNLPTGDLQYLDASYEFRVTNTSNRK
jgi:hypothetical protein